MDPPYEIKTDYETVFNSIRHACKRFSNGIYALWYPVVDRERINHLENRFLNSGLKDIQRFELGMHPDSDEIGMTASGMIVINPPWTLKDTMQLVLPRLSSALGEPGRAFSRCDILVPEVGSIWHLVGVRTCIFQDLRNAQVFGRLYVRRISNPLPFWAVRQRAR
mgnify:CR=1 FL=1